MNSKLIQLITLWAVIIILALWLSDKLSWWDTWLTKQDIQQIVDYSLKKQPSQPVAKTPPPAPNPQAKANKSSYDTFLKWAYVKWNKNAKVSVIEFSDVQCPFCQRHTNNGTLEQVQEKYGDNVNIIFAHFPLGFHQNAQKAWEALECAGKIGGEEAFFAFKKAYFAKWGDSNMELAKQAATDVWLDETKLIDCVNGGEFAQKVKDHMAFGQSLWVTGTPGNIVINNETLETQKVSWAVPASAFDWPISQYIN